MSDMFHEDISDDYIRQVFDVIKSEPQHTFQILTKRVERIKMQCEDCNVSFFFKQWGGWGVDGKKRSKKANGRLLLGRTWDSMPALNNPSLAAC